MPLVTLPTTNPKRNVFNSYRGILSDRTQIPYWPVFHCETGFWLQRRFLAENDRRQELQPSLYAIILCLTGRSDNCGRCKEVRHSVRASDRMHEPACSAHLSGQIPQLPSADSNERPTHTHTYRLTASRRSISIFYTPLHSYIASCRFEHILSARKPLTIRPKLFCMFRSIYKPCAMF